MEPPRLGQIARQRHAPRLVQPRHLRLDRDPPRPLAGNHQTGVLALHQREGAHQPGDVFLHRQTAHGEHRGSRHPRQEGRATCRTATGL